MSFNQLMNQLATGDEADLDEEPTPRELEEIENDDAERNSDQE